MYPNNWTYFILDRDSGQIKIGQSKNPEARLAALRQRRPNLELLATVPDHSKERELHDVFSRQRVTGEWFVPDAELWSYIVRAASMSEVSEDVDEEYEYVYVWNVRAVLILVVFYVLIVGGFAWLPAYQTWLALQSGELTQSAARGWFVFCGVAALIGTVLFIIAVLSPPPQGEADLSV